MKNKIQEITVIAESNYLNFYKISYLNENNNIKSWMVCSRKKLNEYKKLLFDKKEKDIDAVIIVGYNKKIDSIVMIKEFRLPINDYIYSLPAGLIDKGEGFYETSIREFKEETGLTLVDIDKNKTCKKAYSSIGMTDESLAIVFGFCEGSLSQLFLETDEDIIPEYINKKQAKLILNNSENIDIKAWLVLQMFLADSLF